MKYQDLKNTINGDKAIYSTKFKLKVKSNILICKFKASHCSNSSYSSKYNDDLFKADVFEIFITEKDLENYYEFEVAPNNTMFFAKIHYSNNESKDTRLDENPSNSKVFRFLGKTFVTLKIDLEKLNINPNSFFFNAYRIETDGTTPEKHLFALNPTMCRRFHRPEMFIHYSSN